MLGLALLASNIVEAQWTEKLSTQASGAAHSFVADGKMFIIGGYIGFTAGYTTDNRIFDPSTGEWSKGKSPNTANRSAGVGFSINGKGYVGLGQKNFLSFSPSPEDLLDMNEYDPKTDRWTVKAEFPGKARVGATAFVLNDIAYIAGGSFTSNDKSTNELWAYNPADDSWTQKSNMPGKVDGASSFSLNGIGYVVGGIDENQTIVKSTYAYDPETDSWTTKSNLPKINANGTAFTIGSDAYYGLGSNKELGGTDAKFPATFYKYDDQNDSWSTASFEWQNDGRLWPVSGVIDGKAYIGTGYKFDGGEFPYGDFFELDPTITSIRQSNVKPLVTYPNPATSQLFVELPSNQGVVSLLDMRGRLVLRTTLRHINSIDVSAIPTGIYQLKLEADDRTYWSKISVAHQP